MVTKGNRAARESTPSLARAFIWYEARIARYPRQKLRRRITMKRKLITIALMSLVGGALALESMPVSAQRVGFGVNIGVPIAPAYPYGYAAPAPYAGCYYGDPYYPCYGGYYGYGGPAIGVGFYGGGWGHGGWDRGGWGHGGGGHGGGGHGHH
jgi:hypothetical protein